ncbi:hypothetical protein SUGI_1187600 [Cryptomeria japonica]|nr:hypothetical protein SUGI_1187600 [Cryptomeria japonica]
MEKSQQILDEFHSVQASWSLCSKELKQPGFPYEVCGEKRQFELTFHKEDIATIFESYLPYVIAEAKIMELRNPH